MKVRVYYEDTDAGGVVYYANYLKFMERGRTEFLEERGVVINDCVNKGFFFAVASVNINYRFPARYADTLDVKTALIRLKNSSIAVKQEVMRGETLICEAEVVMVCVNREFRPVPIPEETRTLIAE